MIVSDVELLLGEVGIEYSGYSCRVFLILPRHGWYKPNFVILSNSVSSMLQYCVSYGHILCHSMHILCYILNLNSVYVSIHANFTKFLRFITSKSCESLMSH